MKQTMNNQEKPIDKLLFEKQCLKKECQAKERKLNEDLTYIEDHVGVASVHGAGVHLIKDEVVGTGLHVSGVDHVAIGVQIGSGIVSGGQGGGSGELAVGRVSLQSQIVLGARNGDVVDAGLVVRACGESRQLAGDGLRNGNRHHVIVGDGNQHIVVSLQSGQSSVAIIVRLDLVECDADTVALGVLQGHAGRGDLLDLHAAYFFLGKTVQPA